MSVTNNKQRQKRTRSLKNAIVYTDDVTIEAGIDFINWTFASKQKLQVRYSIYFCLDIGIYSIYHMYSNEKLYYRKKELNNLSLL